MSFSSYIYDLISALLVPPLSFVTLYFLGLLLQRWRPEAGKKICIFSLSILLILCTNQGSLLVVSPLENLEAPLKTAKGTDAQAIVVLTCGRTYSAPEYGGKDIPDYIAQTRIRYGAKLYRDTHLPILVTGGMGLDQGYAEPLAVEMARVFENEYQIPVKWKEEASTTTAENAKFSAVILKQANIHKILLVTDAMHMHRARLAFEKAGLEVIPAPTTFYSERSAWRLGLKSFDEHFRQSTYAIHEWIGLLWYQFSNKI